MRPTNPRSSSKKLSNQNLQQESELEWTHLSISTLGQPPSCTHSTPSISTRSSQLPSIQDNLIASSSESLVKISDLQFLTQPNQFPTGESDSSTNFDPQAWKRGDTGTTKRPKRTNNLSLMNAPNIPESSHNPKIQSSLSSSYFIDAAFITPTKRSKSSLDPSSIQRRRATSVTRRISQPKAYQSSSTFTPDQNQINHNSRPSSDLGASRKTQLLSNRSNPPTWKAYTGKDGASSSTRLAESDRQQEFIEALANLRAMARIGKLDYISSNSSSGHINNDNYEIDDGDPDESRPIHADLPTSTFNSAIDEQEAEQSNLISPPGDHHSDPDSVSPSNLSRFFRWSNYIGKAISLKTWQLVGLGGLVFGIGIWAGSSIGRNFSHQRHSRVFKLFW